MGVQLGPRPLVGRVVDDVQRREDAEGRVDEVRQAVFVELLVQLRRQLDVDARQVAVVADARHRHDGLQRQVEHDGEAGSLLAHGHRDAETAPHRRLNVALTNIRHQCRISHMADEA